MDSILELERQTLQEVESFERALFTLLSRNPTTHNQKLQTDHKAAQILDKIQSRAATLNNVLQNENGFAAEVNLLAGSSQQQNDLSEFYARLVKIQEHHSKYPDSVPGGFDLEIAAFLDDEAQEIPDDDVEQEDPIGLLFSGEESYGKYLDLYANHTAFCNIKNVGKRPGYLQYLDLLLKADSAPIHSDLPYEVRSSKDFEGYIQNLHMYLLSFLKRTQPLLDLESTQKEAESSFSSQWEASEITGWQQTSKAKTTNGAAQQDGIWCSACNKHYSKQTVYDAHLTSKKHINAAKKQAESGDAPQTNGTSAANSMPPPQPSIQLRVQNIALRVHLSTSLCTTLSPVIADTKSNVERRFSLTAREREQELMEQAKPIAPAPSAANGEAEEEDEEERLYNPLKLPLGWDGKPIPYWLYKLHGLGVEYRCEICSDQAYMGRKNFERHFQESRHAFGMRALGLPNTKHFHEITRIADALALADKLKREGRHEIFENETMEELEDDEGNVYNRKTYEDLKKQGLI